MPGSRLLPAEQRAALPTAPTTSRRWRTQVLVRSWLARHRQHWLAPLLVCVPPVGVVMVWAGATRPGHSRRWLTAGAAVWTLMLLLLGVVLLAVPGASPADAGDAPQRLAAGPPLVTASRAPSHAQDAASAAAAVRGTPAGTTGLGAAGITVPDVPSSTDPSPSDTSGRDGAATGGGAQPTPAGNPTPAGTGGPAAPNPTPQSPRPTPTPKPRPTAPTTPPHGGRAPHSGDVEQPFSRCTVEGAHAVSPRGASLRCYRTPIGLYWLWG